MYAHHVSLHTRRLSRFLFQCLLKRFRPTIDNISDQVDFGIRAAFSIENKMPHVLFRSFFFSEVSLICEGWLAINRIRKVYKTEPERIFCRDFVVKYPRVFSFQMLWKRIKNQLHSTQCLYSIVNNYLWCYSLPRQKKVPCPHLVDRWG